ncbi:NitT/TauT family transport system substrate-binding protein [Pseudobutyrivibrio sp. AR14]|uniref:ABC transporter substrate-binding protein n=1 Tax=Pseudobutyrivibrio sp. AR14 TaxID=1520804 RepID=UPI000887BA1C|nr:ABC transporter substrate-binding protein [Pseudobutyrivibrio sp. AR14]SCX74944.1 NitT/TauT family transport system substrate-binding protein [Pseudobutyrivibrio sp. AR14]
MKKYLLLTLLVLSTFLLVGCGKAKASESKETVKIAYLPITHSLAALEEAKELEASTDGNIQVELVKYGSWPELLDALNSGQVDGASVLIELAMKSKSEGVGIKAVALGHKDGNVIVVSNDVKDGADLKGRTIAIPHRQSSHNILVNLALEENGLTIDDINVVELAPTEMPSALAAGTIDGYCVAEPFGAMGVSIGAGKVLYESNELWEDSACCALVLTDKFIDERPEAAKEYVEQYKAAGNALTEEEAKAVAKEYLNQKDDVLDISLQWISYDDLEITEEVYDSLVEKVKKYGLSDNPPAYEDFVLSDF